MIVSRPLVGALLAVGVLSTACSSALVVDAAAPPPEAEPTERSEPETGARPGGIDLTLQRDDVDCSEDGLGSDDETAFVVAHVVVGGALGAVCFGEVDPTLVAAWEALSTITPPLQLADLGLFGGFESLEAGDEFTLAFVDIVDVEGSQFQMAINLDAYGADENEALLTMAHEFSHVFTGVSSQLDRTYKTLQPCETYSSGDGCYEPDSLIFQWIERFWAGGLIDEIDPFAEPSAADGQERCDLNPGFFGSYAASNPEEDFAEAFSAFVFRLEPSTDEQQEKLEWLALQPGLAEFRDRAAAAGIGPLENTFDRCGAGA